MANKDNRALLEADPSYVGKLKNLSRVDRSRLLGDEERGGNWHTRAGAGTFLRKQDFRIGTESPSRIVRTVRCWDKGSTAPSHDNPDPDWTRGVRVSLCQAGELWIDDLVSLRDRPAVVFRRMRETAEGRLDPRGRVIRPGDGVGVTVGLWQEVGASGKVDNEVTIDVVSGFPTQVVRIGADKLAYARVWVPLLEQGRVWVKRAPWNEALLNECDSFPDGSHDDIVDAISLAAQLLLGKSLGFWNQMSKAQGARTGGRR